MHLPSSPPTADLSQRWVLWIVGLALFFAPFLAPLAPFARRNSSDSQAILSSETGGRWQLAGERRWAAMGGDDYIAGTSERSQIGAVQGVTFASEQGLTTLFSWSPQGLWRSADYGRTWTSIGAGLPATRMGALALIDLQPGGVHTLYALAGPAGRRGLYRSSDRGARFDLLYQPLTFNPELLAVQVSEEGDIVSLAGDDTLVLSQDGGASWRDFRTPGPVAALAMTDLGLWAAGSGGTNVDGAGFGDQTPTGWVAYTTRNGEVEAGEHGLGQQWQLKVLPDGVQPRFLVGAERGPVQWYLGHDTGLLRSSDSGASWQPVSLPEDAAPAALVLDPLIWQTLLLIDTSGKFWRSDDAGASWRMLAVPDSGAIRHLFLVPDDRDRLFAVAGFDLWWLSQTLLQPTPSPTPTPTASSSPASDLNASQRASHTATPPPPIRSAGDDPATHPPSPSPTLSVMATTAPRSYSPAVPVRQPVSGSTAVPSVAPPTTVATATPLPDGGPTALPPDTPGPSEVTQPTATPQPPPPTPVPTATSYR